MSATSPIESCGNHHTDENPFVIEMMLGRAALRRRDLMTASSHFDRAHRIGHDDLSQHLAVHQALLLVAWANGSMRQVAAELYSLVALRLLGVFLKR
jgi:hypothetical protein